MSRQLSHTPRHLDILHSIVQAYIETGEPVASRTISRRLGSRLSPASVRNVMADLFEDGFLTQPHTSAGRIPTEQAFRSYVQSLSKARVLAAELQRLREELSQVETVEGRVERSSHILTEMTRGIGIAAAIPTLSQVLDQVELIRLADRRVLMVVVTRDRMVRNRVVALDEPVGDGELESIRNYINQNFSGWALLDVHAELSRRLAHESAVYDSVLRKLTLLHARGLLDFELSPEIHLEGASNLVGLDLHLTREKLRELFRTLEEKKRLLQMLERFLEQREGEVAVQIGLGDVYPSMRELSLIGISVGLPGGLAAKIAVLGPLRMNYEKAMSAVLHLGQAFQSLDDRG
ncbi:MAG TPA: heat-inducible transcriptional repressor HrcA [Bryobacteraceae bacterium]|nr:heat-inducible transcriptional repressor HrcA [Bryobacteraceae bacterium]